MMNKLQNKPTLHYTIVLILVALICAGLIFGVHLITNPIIQNNVYRTQKDQYAEVLPELTDFDSIDLTNTPSSIVTAVIGKNNQGESVGAVIIAEATNQFGDMRIIVGVNAEGNITGAKFLSINQTLGVEDTFTNLSYYVGSPISSLTPSGDLIGGATYSLNTVEALLSDAAVVFAGLSFGPTDPYVIMFGSSFSYIEIDTDYTVTETIVQKEIAYSDTDEILGYIYKLTGSSIYNDDSATEASITVYIALDTDDRIVGVTIPREEYHHSLGAFYGRVNNYGQTLIGQSIHNYSGDIASGSSNSKGLLDTLLSHLSGVLS